MVCGEISLICGDNTNYSLLNSEAGSFQVIMAIVPLYPGLVKLKLGPCTVSLDGLKCNIPTCILLHVGRTHYRRSTPTHPQIAHTVDFSWLLLFLFYLVFVSTWLLCDLSRLFEVEFKR